MFDPFPRLLVCLSSVLSTTTTSKAYEPDSCEECAFLQNSCMLKCGCLRNGETRAMNLQRSFSECNVESCIDGVSHNFVGVVNIDGILMCDTEPRTECKSAAPTPAPGPTASPTAQPTGPPTPPTEAPTPMPTDVPTACPSVQPTTTPTHITMASLKR
jgi:hypothetical protein